MVIFKEAAPKSSVYGGVKTFSFKKGLVGRMTMIQSALDSSDLGEYFRYPQRHEKVYRLRRVGRGKPTPCKTSRNAGAFGIVPTL